MNELVVLIRRHLLESRWLLGLSAAACAVHGACDGNQRVDQLPAVCGLDAFDTLHQLSVLVDAGLVSVYA